MTRQMLCWAGYLSALFLAVGAWAGEVALVTSAKGGIRIEAEAAAAAELKAFVKLRAGDRIALDEGARLQLVYFDGGRQEIWRGPGMLEAGSQASEARRGNPQVEAKTLPAILVRQLAKTPVQGGGVKAGMLRLRTMPSAGTLESVERQYATLRSQADPGDRNPELYLLAGYFDLRAFDKVAALLDRICSESPQDHEVQLLKSLYERAMNNARTAAQ